MKQLTLLFSFLVSNILFSQEFKIKSIESPQFGSISSSKVKIKLTDSLIIISEEKEEKEFFVQKTTIINERKQYTTITKNNKTINFTWNEKQKTFYVKPEDESDKNALVLTFYY
jgi:hypothetical protein